MASPCLYLDIDHTGICATISASGSREIFTIRYKDLSDTDGSKASFKEAMEVLAGKTDLSLCRFALVLIPSSWICFRHTLLPFSHEKRIQQVLPMELAPGLPEAGAPVLLDFCVVDVGLETGQHLVLSGALPEKRMEEIFNVLKTMGIHLKLVAPRGYAQAMAFLDRHPQLTDLIYVHWSSTDTILTLITNRSPLVVRSLGNKDYLPFPEEGKWDVKGLGKEIARTLIGASIETALEKDPLTDIKIIISASNQDLNEDQAGKIIDCLHRETASFIQRDISMDLQEPLSWSEAITETRQPPFLLNFCKGRFKTNSFLAQYKPHLITCLVLLSISFSLGVISLHKQNSALEAQVARLRQTSMEIYRSTFPKTGKSSIHAPLLLMESKIKQAKKAYSGDGGEKWQSGLSVKVLDILYDISSRIPDSIDINISRLVLNHGRLILTGSTGNFNEVDNIKGKLQSSPRFKSVTINSAEADKNGKRIRFKFILEI